MRSGMKFGTGKDSYVRVWARDGKSILYHRLLIENRIGRPLTKDEIVHHINGNRRDNRIKNLKLCVGRCDHNHVHASEYCPHGHKFTPENTLYHNNPNGRPARRCRTCHKLNEAERRRKILSD